MRLKRRLISGRCWLLSAAEDWNARAASATEGRVVGTYSRLKVFILSLMATSNAFFTAIWDGLTLTFDDAFAVLPVAEHTDGSRVR
jgi:hypothetical protein